MIRGLFVCAIACSVAAPVAAGERNIGAPGMRILPVPILAVSDRFPGYDSALTVGGDIAVRLRSVPVPVVALAYFENRASPDFHIIPANLLPGGPAMLVSPYAVAELRSLKAWRLADRLAPVTASANGFYAVGDVLAEHPKPRAFRPSALSTLLVLRVDGKDESPPFSVGGGGVAAALWRVMPQ
jgi:hypothetical protein